MRLFNLFECPVKKQRYSNEQYPALTFVRYDRESSKFACTLSRRQLSQLGVYFTKHDNETIAPINGEYVSGFTNKMTPYRHGRDYDIDCVCEKIFRTSKSVLLVYLTVNSAPIGFLSYSYFNEKHFDLYFDYLYIIPQQRGHGHAKAIVFHLFESLRRPLNKHRSWKAYLHYEIDNSIADRAIRKAVDQFRPRLHKGYRFAFRTE